MKTLLILALAALAASIATADVIIADDGTIVKDGVSLNNSWDALLNKQIAAKEFGDALKSKLAAAAKAVTDAQAAAVTAGADKLAIVEALKTADGKTGAERLAALRAAIDTAKADAKAKLIAERQAARDAAQAALDEAKK